MPSFRLFTAFLLLVVLGGGFAWLALSDIAAPQSQSIVEIPAERFAADLKGTAP